MDDGVSRPILRWNEDPAGAGRDRDSSPRVSRPLPPTSGVVPMATDLTTRRRIVPLSALLGGLLALPATTAPVFAQHHGHAGGGGMSVHRGGRMSPSSQGFAQPRYHQMIAQPQHHPATIRPQ